MDRYKHNDWYKKLDLLRTTDPRTFIVELKDIMRETFRAMDLISILVLHSRVPGLREVFVTEWIATIIPVWVQGQCFVEERKDDEERQDLFQCFREIYEDAQLTQRWFPYWYPKRGLSVYVLRSCIHVCIVVKDIRRAIRNLWSSKT